MTEDDCFGVHDFAVDLDQDPPRIACRECGKALLQLTPDGVTEAAKKLAENESLETGKYDPESAHIEEDLLLDALIRLTAAGRPEAQKLAEAALPTLDAEQTRWHA